MPPKPDQNELEPGADRFWGQFSQSKAGRSTEAGDGSRVGSDPEGDSANAENCLDWCPICRSAELFRHTVSPELRQQAESIQHEAMGVFKAFLDAYADKANAGESTSTDRDPASPPRQDEDPPSPRVTDIPLS